MLLPMSPSRLSVDAFDLDSNSQQKHEFSPPPPYDNARQEFIYRRLKSKFRLGKSPALERRIAYTDIPQWKWSGEQCREWFAAVLIHCMNYGTDEAVRKAQELHGFGPSIYTRTHQDWIDLLGGQSGEGLHAMLIGVRSCKGAVPSSVRLGHGNVTAIN